MVFYPRYPQEVFDFIKESKLNGKNLRDEIKQKFGYDIPRNSIYNLVSHHRLGKKYIHAKCIPSWNLKPLGTERKDKDGYILVRVEGGEKRKHFIEWEKYHEPTKPDECLMFLDGDRTNCDIYNLFLMKRKYMGAMNYILKGIKDTELKKTAITAAILKLEAREKEIQLNKDNPHRKPKNDRWKDIIRLYSQGKTTSEISKELGRNKAVIRWTVRRYNLGIYGDWNGKTYHHIDN